MEAQAQAARTSWEFIQNVGLYADGEEKKTVNVSFQFIKDGRMAQITVPLLTIVPIPYIAINSIDINFKANISASAASTETENSSSSVDTSVSASARCFWARGSMNASYSSKKDSSATRDSKYSVEYTMDVAVHAGQDSMPAGMAKVLEMLNNSISVVSPEGFLDVQHAIQDDGTVKLITSYKNREGLFDPEAITPEARLYEDLELDSIDAVDMVVHLQKKTGARIKPETFKSVRTVQDVVDAVEKLLREA